MPKSALAVSMGGSVGTQYWGVQCGEHLGCAELAHTVQCLSCECEDLSSYLQHRQKAEHTACIHKPRLRDSGLTARLGELVNSGSDDRSCLPPQNKVMSN